MRVESSPSPPATRRPLCWAWSLEAPLPRSAPRGSSQLLSLSRGVGAVQGNTGVCVAMVTSLLLAEPVIPGSHRIHFCLILGQQKCYEKLTKMKEIGT